jgi:hypothetical protein
MKAPSKIRQQELKYQKVIVDSYRKQGGFCERWNNEWVKGPPDLVCAYPVIGLHLIEVKHRPTWAKTIKNPMEEKQLEYANNYAENGGEHRVYLGIIRGGGDKVLDSEFALFSPYRFELHPDEGQWVPYTKGLGYDLEKLDFNCHGRA